MLHAIQYIKFKFNYTLRKMLQVSTSIICDASSIIK